MLLHTLYSAVSVMALSRCTVLCFGHYVRVDKSSLAIVRICGTICPLGTCTLCADALECHKVFSPTFCGEPLNVHANSREVDSKNLKHWYQRCQKIKMV